MKRAALWTVVLAILVSGGLLATQAFGEEKEPQAVCPMTGKPIGQGPGLHGMMGGKTGMMGHGSHGGCPMMGGGPGEGMPCPLMGPGTKIETKKIDKGVQITVTTDDPKAAARLQKMAEIMKLTHELHQME
ncbi:MAG: hypothetical protein AB1405_12815 [Bdellovibrionota bacterium]